MKQLKDISNASSKYFAIATFFLSQTIVWAQEKDVNVDLNVNKGGGDGWYLQPWAWIVGAAIFIIIIVALLKGKSD